MENNQWFSKTREILNKLNDLKGIDGNKYGDIRAVFIYHITIQYKADIDDVVTKLFEELNKKLTSEELNIIKNVINTHYSERKTIGYYMSIFDMLLISFGVEKIKNLQRDDIFSRGLGYVRTFSKARNYFAHPTEENREKIGELQQNLEESLQPKNFTSETSVNFVSDTEYVLIKLKEEINKI